MKTTNPRHRWSRSARIALAMLGALAGCAPEKHAVGLWIQGAASVSVASCTPYLTALAAFSDGSEDWVTADAEWASSATTVLTVGPGLVQDTWVNVTCAGPGETNITATYDGVVAAAPLTVRP